MKKKEVNGFIIDAQGKKHSKESYAKQTAYRTAYNARKYKMYNVRFLKAEDQDIIEKLAEMESLNKYITDLVRKNLRGK